MIGLALPFLLVGLPTASAEEEGLSEAAARYLCLYKPTYFILGVVERDRTNPTTNA